MRNFEKMAAAPAYDRISGSGFLFDEDQEDNMDAYGGNSFFGWENQAEVNPSLENNQVPDNIGDVAAGCCVYVGNLSYSTRLPPIPPLPT